MQQANPELSHPPDTSAAFALGQAAFIFKLAAWKRGVMVFSAKRKQNAGSPCCLRGCPAVQVRQLRGVLAASTAGLRCTALPDPLGFSSHRVDEDSALHNDLQILKEKEGTDYILLNFSFKVRLPLPERRLTRRGIRELNSSASLLSFQDNFPFDPPFVRVVSPVLSGG